MNITLMLFNNYFNRKLKRLDSLNDYLSLCSSSNSATYTDINFIPNDDVDTEQILNSSNDSNLNPNEFDYALVYDTNHFSRWFITEAIRLRNGQWKLHLKRDVIADNYEEIKKDPIFVERAWLKDSDPMIYNDEGMNFNQIKIGEKLLYSNPTNDSPAYVPKNAWIIGYVEKKELQSEGSTLTSITVPSDPVPGSTTLAEVAAYTGIDETILTNVINWTGLQEKTINYLMGSNSANIEIEYKTVKNSIWYRHSIYFKDNYTFDNALKASSVSGDVIYSGGLGATGQEHAPEDQFIWTNGVSLPSIIKAVNQQSYDIISYDSMNKLNQLITNGLVIFYNSKNYRIGQPTNKEGHNENKSFGINESALFQVRNNILSNTFFNDAVIDNTGSVNFRYSFYSAFIAAEELTSGSYNIPISTLANRRSCSGSVFDVFAIPFGKTNIAWDDGQGELLTQLSTLNDTNLLLRIASTIATELSAQCYDIQLLPYCPIMANSKDYQDANCIDIRNMTEHTDYDWIQKSGVNQTIIFWLGSNKHSESIRIRQTVSNPKIQSQTEMLRIVSPNGQGCFDMNVAKNGGIENVRINMTLKPYSPSIQVLPEFKQLYGGDFNDYRGLLCGGDFSLPRVEEAWIQYQLQNKNYQNTFAREIKSLDVKQAGARLNQTLATIGAVAGGTIAGAATGAKYGGAIGAVAGGAFAGLASGVTGMATFGAAEDIRRDERDLAFDRYNYQLGNIQAQPDTISKIDSFVINSKLFPYLEFYKCSEQEENALIEKIKYQSMSVQRIGTIEEFRSEEEPHFFKGEYIMNSDNTIQSDTHTLNAIYAELLKGLYL